METPFDRPVILGLLVLLSTLAWPFAARAATEVVPPDQARHYVQLKTRCNVGTLPIKTRTGVFTGADRERLLLQVIAGECVEHGVYGPDLEITSICVSDACSELGRMAPWGEWYTSGKIGRYSGRYTNAAGSISRFSNAQAVFQDAVVVAGCPAGYEFNEVTGFCEKECACDEELVDGQCAPKEPVYEKRWLEDGRLKLHPYGLASACRTEILDQVPPRCEVGDDGNGPSTGVGNPVNCATGTKTQTETDYRGTGPDPLVVRRHYRSDAAALAGPLTLMADDNTVRLRYDQDWDIVRLRWPDGSRLVFDADTGHHSSPVALGRLVPRDNGWDYVDTRGRRFRFSADGLLLNRRLPDGRTRSLVHHETGPAAGKIATVTNSFGQQLLYDYDEAGRQTGVRLPDGGVIHYGYDDEDRLVSVTYPDGATKTYHYEDPDFVHALTGITDENGHRYASWEYDVLGRAVQSEHAGGADRVTLDYLDEGRTAVRLYQSDDEFRETVYHHQHFGSVHRITRIETTCADCPASDREWYYDERGHLASRSGTDGNITHSERDDRGLETKRTEAWGTPDERIVTTDWHEAFRLPVTITDPDRVTEYTYDGNGNRLSQTITDTVSGESRTTSWTHGNYGRVLTVNGPRTDVSDITTYTYDARGNVSTVTNAVGQVTRYTDYDAHDNPLEIIDANGIVTALEYDLRQRLVSRTVAAGTADAATTSFNYDAVGQLIETVLPNGASIHYDYDAAHRLVAIEDNLGNRIDYTLDAMGNRIFDTVSGPGGAVFRETSHEYNTLNRLVASIGGEGQRTTYDYDADGNRTGMTDDFGNPTTNRYDALDRLFETVDALGGITQYHYDPSDNLVQVVDPRGVTTGYTYNGFSELTETTSPDAGTTTYTYDKAGNRISQTDARGITVNYQYDALNRLTFIDYPGMGQDITYTYDEGPNGIGRLSRITDETGSTEYYYGPRGNLLSKVSIVNGITLAVDYSIDIADNLTGVHYPSGAAVSYSRDVAGRVTAVTLTDLQGNATVLADGIRYVPFGPITGMDYGNGITETRTFDRDGRITRIQSSALDTGYTWDTTNNITSISDTLDSTRNQSFNYDALYRLTHATGSYGNLDWQYDPVGNRTQQMTDDAITDYDYALDANRLVAIDGPNGSIDYHYDETGNTLTDGDNSYGYDARNRLVKVDDAYTYQHNALGQRVTKPRFQTVEPGDANGDGIIDENDLLVLRDILRGRTAATPGADCNSDGNVNNKDTSCIATQIGDNKNKGRKNRETEDVGSETTSTSNTNEIGQVVGEILFVYDEVGHLLGEYDETGTVIREYVWLGDRPVAMIDNSGNIHYIHTDHLNTPKVVTDESQAVAWKADYQPFGKADIAETSTIEFNLRFPGQYADQETGLNYNYFRSYNPATGRYTQSDPIGLRGGLNTFAYILGNPVRYVDPLGLDWQLGGDYSVTDNMNSIICDGEQARTIITNFDDYGCTGLTSCARKHERSHLEDAGGSSICKGNKAKKYIVGDPATVAASEVKAYKVELQCLERSRRSRNCTEGCKGAYDGRIKDIQENLLPRYQERLLKLGGDQ